MWAFCHATHEVGEDEDTQLNTGVQPEPPDSGQRVSPTAALPWLNDYNYYFCFLKCSISGLNHVCLLF